MKRYANACRNCLYLSTKSQLAPLATGERDSLVKQDDLYHHYSQYVDNESAFELLNAKAEAIKAEQAAAEEANNDFFGGILSSILARRRKRSIDYRTSG